MAELGVETANSDGTLRDFQTVLGDLGGALDGLTDDQRLKAMSRIFDTRTISAANALIANSGERWNELSDSIGNAGGAADQMAETQLNNLQGQLTILKSSIEGAGISFGKILLPTISKLATAFQNLMNWLNGLDESQKKTLVTILEIAAAVGPMLLIFGKLSTAISSIIGLFSGGGGLAAVLTAITGPIGIVIAAVAALAAMWITDFAGIREATSSILQSIGEIISTFVNFFVGLWESNFMGIQGITASVWNAIETLFSTVFSVISGLFEAFAAAFKGDWEGTWEAVKNVAVTIWNGLKSVFSSLLAALVILLINIGSSLLNAAKTVFGKIKEGFEIAWDAVLTWATNAFNSIVDTVSGIAGAMYEAGAAVFTSLYDGFLSIWGKISSWASEKLNWLKNLFSDVKVNVSANTKGSYASGIDYITHDQLVQVHEGEAILTKEENRERLQAGNRSGSGDTYNFYSPKALNPTTAAREMKRAKQQLALGV